MKICTEFLTSSLKIAVLWLLKNILLNHFVEKSKEISCWPKSRGMKHGKIHIKSLQILRITFFLKFFSILNSTSLFILIVYLESISFILGLLYSCFILYHHLHQPLFAHSCQWVHLRWVAWLLLKDSPVNILKSVILLLTLWHSIQNSLHGQHCMCRLPFPDQDSLWFLSNW